MAALNDFSTFDMYSDDSLLLVIDEQERLVPALHEGQKMLDRSALLINAAIELQIPVIKTEQYPKGLGQTVEPINSLCEQAGSDNYEKLDFNAINNEVRTKLRMSGRQRILVVGCETHICVMQTVRALLKQGYFVFVAADAVTSRNPLDKEIAFEQMRNMGAVITTAETVIYDWLKQAGTPAFKNLAKLIK